MMRELFMGFNWFSIVFRLLLAVLVGGVIGNERARHGRAAGMRTHILVCMGSAMTAMTGIFMSQVYDYNGDVFRISAQVVSGIGFLGAGMIIVKNNSVITGLTTAAGIWATAAIGIAAGYGFYVGVLAATIICLLTIILLARFERNSKSTESMYVELDDIYATNDVIDNLMVSYDGKIKCHVTKPKSGTPGHIGIELTAKNGAKLSSQKIRSVEKVVYVIDE